MVALQSIILCLAISVKGTIKNLSKGITQTLIPDTLVVKPKASQSTDGNLLWSVVYISDTACLCTGVADDTQPAFERLAQYLI
jgi:hypothetical protein